MSKRTSYLSEKLKGRKIQNALRVLPVDNKYSIDFCSNDYLGFARSEELQDYSKKFFSDFTLNGSTGSRLISGNSDFVEGLEKEIAAFHQAESGLIFNSGYTANLGLLSCIASRQDTIVYDELVHASIRDGIRLSVSKSFSFRHNDLTDLEKKIKQANSRAFVVVESIYSMDGDAAPLQQLVKLKDRLGFSIIVDEAHALGVFGQKGEGLVGMLGLENAIWARVYTFGKALGGHGAIVVGSDLLRTFLVNFSRPFIYTTALAPHTFAMIKGGYDFLKKTTAINLLEQRIQYFKSQLSPLSKKQFIPSHSAIHCLVHPGNLAVKAFAKHLQAQDFDIRPILHPTVPEGKERLRICLHAFNTDEQIKSLTGLINNWLENYRNE